VVDLLDETAALGGPWDVSAGGMCLLIEPHYEPGTPIELQLRTPPPGPSLHLFARVVHTVLAPSSRDMWLTGCALQGEPLSAETLQSCI
jgi:hypothetical protein